MAEMLPNIHPGEVLLEEFLEGGVRPDKWGNPPFLQFQRPPGFEVPKS